MENVYSGDKIHQAGELIQKASRIVITAHKSPDGDAVGASLALYHYLNNIGKNCCVIMPDDYPEFLKWLPGSESVVIYDQSAESASEIISKADLIFSLDYNLLSRTGKMQNVLKETGAPFILIDHHQQPGDYPRVTFSDTSATSTAEMVYAFIEAQGGHDLIDVNTGTCIYCGIMTDSGSFRFPNVSPYTHRIVAQLLEIGVDHAEIHRKVYDNNLINRLKLVGYSLSQKLKTINGAHAAYISLSKKELESFNFQPGDTEGLVNYALSIKGINLAVFMREGNNIIKFSFRSKGDFDVNRFAREYFQGGGHKNAAGGALKMPFEKAEELLLKSIKSHADEMDY